jgi:predicted kinase
MLFILRGTSCSGKGTFSGKFFDQKTIISSDDMRLRLFDTLDVPDRGKNDEVFKFMNKILESRLSYKVSHTVIDATNLRIKYIEEFLNLARKYACGVTMISILPPDLDELKKRNRMRAESGKHVLIPEDVIERHFETYFNAMPAFLDYEKQNPSFFKFTEIDQNYEVIR